MIRLIRRWLAAQAPETPLQPPKWLSWYKSPMREETTLWLCRMPREDLGWYYSADKGQAFRFDSMEAALKPTPTYDGSSNISSRAGVCEDR